MVLVKPGDVLIIGNVGQVPEGLNEQLGELLGDLREALGLAHVVVFDGDIDLAVARDAVAEDLSDVAGTADR